MKRPQPIVPRKLTLTEQNTLAERAIYEGSKEHKLVRWWGGLPGALVDDTGSVRPRSKKQQTTICPLTSEAERRQATLWVQNALKSGNYHFVQGDQDFPKHVWHKADGQEWFGFCINSVAGQYKGWPLEPGELDAFLDRLAG